MCEVFEAYRQEYSNDDEERILPERVKGDKSLSDRHKDFLFALLTVEPLK